MGFNFLYSSGTASGTGKTRTRPAFDDVESTRLIRILIIEDDLDFSAMLTRRLSKQTRPKIETAVSTTLRQALLRLGSERFDLVLLDLTLPDSREMETYMKVRSAAPRTPVVILTGWGDDAAALTAVREGAEDFLVKGEIDGKMIPRVIHYALERHKIKEDLEDATRRIQEINANLEARALFDTVTGLLNRNGFRKALDREIQWAARHGWNLIVMMADLDGFRSINTLQGYAAGDEVLKKCAGILCHTLRTTDHVCRIADDRFVLLLPETSQENAQKIAERILAGINGSGGSPAGTSITASIGLAKVYGMTGSADILLTRLNSLVRRAKEQGGNRIIAESEYVVDLERDEVSLEALLTKLRSADEYYAVKQPIVRLLDSSVVGYEILSRFKSPECRRPIDFFRMALENNMLTQVDFNCFTKCVETASTLGETGALYHINVFPSTLVDMAVEDFTNVLPPGMAKAKYCLEISLSRIHSDPAYLIKAVRGFKEAGFEIALDNAGFGHSSLESLVALEPAIIKLDARYVHGISDDRERLRYLERTVRIVKALGARVIAEGIETQLDLNTLISLGVEYGQGILLGAPA